MMVAEVGSRGGHQTGQGVYQLPRFVEIWRNIIAQPGLHGRGTHKMYRCSIYDLNRRYLGNVSCLLTRIFQFSSFESLNALLGYRRLWATAQSEVDYDPTRVYRLKVAGYERYLVLRARAACR